MSAWLSSLFSRRKIYGLERDNIGLLAFLEEIVDGLCGRFVNQYFDH